MGAAPSLAGSRRHAVRIRVFQTGPFPAYEEYIVAVLLLSVHGEQVETQSRNLGLHRITHYLRRHGMSCDICEIGLDDAGEYLAKAEQGAYSLIGLSSTYVFLEKELQAFLPFKRAAERCRAFTCTGGQAPSRAAAFWLDLGFDGIIRGYGEIPMLELARVLEGTPAGASPDLRSVPGLTWRDGPAIVENPPMRLTPAIFRELNYTNAKEMGIPAAWRSLLSENEPEKGEESSRYRAFKAWRLFTSHKCPNRCGYCSSSNFLEQVYGRDSASFGLTVEEVIDLVSFYYTTYGISFFNIHDDDFTSPKRFTREFCRRVIELKQRGELPPQMAFFCQSRVVDFLDLKTRQPDMEILRLMKAAGFHRISFGVENFSEKMLLTPIMHKKGYDDAVIMELVRAARRLDIESGVNFMICVPEAEPEDVRLNLERLVDVQEMNGIAIMNMYIQSYPGSFAFGNPRYPAVTSQHVSPLNGWEYVKQQHFIPHHPRVRDALAHYMECGVRDAVAAYKQQYPNVHVQEMKMLNLIKANVMARHLGFDGLVARLEKSIQQRAAFLKTQGN